jgi:alkanesulfonate monooxygenase
MAPPAPQSQTDRPVQFAWFAALCDDDTGALGDPDAALPSSFSHCLDITLEAERQGFDQILCPSGYELGIDAVTFAAAAAARTEHIEFLVAIRTGELYGPQLVRQMASLDDIAGGRIAINIISSDLPGSSEPGTVRYGRTASFMDLLHQGLEGAPLPPVTPGAPEILNAPRIARTRLPRTPLYFGGLSEEARDAAARGADVYLMWPEPEAGAAALIADMTERAHGYRRHLGFGLRIHVIVRDSEDEARAAARALIAAVDAPTGEAIISRSLDATSAGVAHQRELRERADDEGYVEPGLWTGIGRARSGCGAAIVGDPDQVEEKLRRYMALGIDAFILSGYPHIDECRRFGELVLPRFTHGRLSRG